MQHNEQLELLNAEKNAIDQILVEQLKINIITKRELFLAQSRIKKLEDEIQVLNENLEKTKKDLQYEAR